MPCRIAVLAGIFLVEKFLLHFSIDVTAATEATGFADTFRVIQSQLFHFLATTSLCLAALSYAKFKKTGQRAFSDVLPKVHWGWLCVHALLIAAAAPLAYQLYGHSKSEVQFALLATACIASLITAAAAALRAMAPWPAWKNAAVRLGSLWSYAIAAAAVATWSLLWWQTLWRRTAWITFEVVRLMLKPVLPTLSADASERILSTDRFSVQIAEGCSGLEGVGLMLAFCGCFLVLFRDEYRFPRALTLIPIGLAIVFLLNSVRIAALVLIGDAGYPEVADYGFHTQAGWLGFTFAAAAVAVLSRKGHWLIQGPGHAAVSRSAVTASPAAAYLSPFLALQAAAMISLAMSAKFDWLYPARAATATIAFLYFRPQLVSLNWRFSFRGPLVGATAFMIWVLLGHLMLTPEAMPTELSEYPPARRLAWMAVRALSAASIVPVVEELAFRGYLLRRLVAPRFETVPFQATTRSALLLSSAAFGAAHGAMWAPGLIAGALYGLLAVRTGAIGESIAAHATTNLLLAFAVLVQGQWQFWL